MKRPILLISMLLFLLNAVSGLAKDASDETGAGNGPNVSVILPLPQEAAETGSSEEVEILEPEQQVVRQLMDERILRVEQAAQEQIRAVAAEINQLEDKGEEPGLQKVIEKIKLDAELARLRIHMQDAEADDDVELADEFNHQIDYLGNLNEPVIGIPREQPSP